MMRPDVRTTADVPVPEPTPGVAEGRTAFQELLQLVHSYGAVAEIELADVLRDLPEARPVLLDQSVDRMQKVLGLFRASVDVIAAKLMLQTQAEGSQEQVMAANNAKLVVKYNALGAEIREHLTQIRSSFGPETGQGVVDAVIAISDCVRRMESTAGLEVRP